MLLFIILLHFCIQVRLFAFVLWVSILPPVLSINGSFASLHPYFFTFTLCLFNLAITLLFPMVLVIRPWPLGHSAGCGYCSLLLQSCFLVCVSALQPRPLSLCWWFCFRIWKLSLWVLVISVFVFDSLILVLHPDSWSLSLGYLGWDLSLGFLVFGFTLGPWNLIPGSWSLILGFQLLFIYLPSLAPDFDSRSCYWPTWVF